MKNTKTLEMGQIFIAIEDLFTRCKTMSRYDLKHHMEFIPERDTAPNKNDYNDMAMEAIKKLEVL